MKRITESVSQCYETESVFRFPYILTFFAAQRFKSQTEKKIKALRDHRPQKMKLSKILNESRVRWRRNGRRRNSNSNVLGVQGPWRRSK